MLIPLHLIPIPAEEPRSLGEPGHAWQRDSDLKIAPGVRLGDIRALGLTGIGMAGSPVATRDLLRFGQLMNDAGLAINPTRMLYDRPYAHDRLADALASRHDALRDVALDLYDAFQASGEWIGLAH